MEKMTDTAGDWELSEDYYSQEEGKKLKLEDFLEENSEKPEKEPELLQRLKQAPDWKKWQSWCVR